MNRNRRPLAVTILASVYIAVGTIGFVYHFSELQARAAFHSDMALAEVTELLAVLCGAFMLRGHDWARWLALAWMVFHVILSAFHALSEFTIHCLFCAVIAWVVFRRDTVRYFQAARPQPM